MIKKGAVKEAFTFLTLLSFLGIAAFSTIVNHSKKENPQPAKQEVSQSVNNVKPKPGLYDIISNVSTGNINGNVNTLEDTEFKRNFLTYMPIYIQIQYYAKNGREMSLSKAQGYANQILLVGETFNFPPITLAAILDQESDFDRKCVGSRDDSLLCIEDVKVDGKIIYKKGKRYHNPSIGMSQICNVETAINYNDLKEINWPNLPSFKVVQRDGLTKHPKLSIAMMGVHLNRDMKNWGISLDEAIQAYNAGTAIFDDDFKNKYPNRYKLLKKLADNYLKGVKEKSLDIGLFISCPELYAQNNSEIMKLVPSQLYSSIQDKRDIF